MWLQMRKKRERKCGREKFSNKFLNRIESMAHTDCIHIHILQMEQSKNARVEHFQ